MKRILMALVVVAASLSLAPTASAGIITGSKITVTTETQLEPPTQNFPCRGAVATLKPLSGQIAYLSSFNITVQNSAGYTLRYAGTTASSDTAELSARWDICTFDDAYRGTVETYVLKVSFYDAGGLGRSENLDISVSFRAGRTKQMVQEELQRACMSLSGSDINWQLDMRSKARLPKSKLTIKGKVYRSAFLVTNTKITIRTMPASLGGKVIASQLVKADGKINITFDSKKSKYGLYYLTLPSRSTAIRGYLPFGGFYGAHISIILGRKNGYLTLPKVPRDSVPAIPSQCQTLMAEYAAMG